MATYFTDEVNAQVVIFLLKAHGIRKVVASPGTTNVAFIASIQHDSDFEIYSVVDERSAAYLACGLAAESGEAVVISCTGATASRNYLPGLTEAFYRKLPILAITSSQAPSRVGHHVAQVIDRSVKPKDAARMSIMLPIVKDDDDLWDCENKVNQAILELWRHGGGPVHLNLPTRYSRAFTVKELPSFRVIRRIGHGDPFPKLPEGRIAIFVGAHKTWTGQETLAVEQFCASNNAVVICDHCSGYRGKYRLQYALSGGQVLIENTTLAPDLLIHIGEVTGDYYGSKIGGSEVWRVSKDGEIRDTFRKLRCVFEMPELTFFEHYKDGEPKGANNYYEECASHLDKLRKSIPETPFSNIWMASRMAHQIPQGALVYFGILNSLRAWNFFELPESVVSASNVGGFGIDGGVSSLVGASLVNRERLCFGIVGDLAFFYDMNILGNRHIGRNLRILLVNNGKGTEFRQYGHHALHFGEDADQFIAAAGHFGRQSRVLVKHYAEDLGFEYLSASSKDEFEQRVNRFLTPAITDRPMVFEVFTQCDEESRALEMMLCLAKDTRAKARQLADQIVGARAIQSLKKLVR